MIPDTRVILECSELIWLVVVASCLAGESAAMAVGTEEGRTLQMTSIACN